MDDPSPHETPIHRHPKTPVERPLAEEDEPFFKRPAWQQPFLDMLLAFSRHRLIFLVFLSLGAIQAFVKLKTTPSFYRSSAVAILMPREKPVLEASIDTGSFQTTEDVARRAPSASLTLPPNVELYVTLLKSRPILEKLAAQYIEELHELQGFPRNHRSDEIIADLTAMLSVTGTEDGLMTVSVTSDNPQLACDIANSLINEGEAASKSVERQLLLKQAEFLDESVESALERLDEAKNDFEKFSKKHGLVDPDYQGVQTLLEIRMLRRETQNLRGDLQARLLHYTDDDPEVRRLRERIDENERTETEIQNNIVRGVGTEGFGKLITEYDALQQVLRFRRDLYVTLSTQADIFRIRADQPTGSMAIIRKAIPASMAAGPSKKMIVGVSFALALIAAIALSLFLEQLAQVRKDPTLNDTVDTIRKNLLGSPKSELGKQWGLLKSLVRRKSA